MEYLEGGSLQELIKSSKGNLDEHTTQWILREILKVGQRGGVGRQGLKRREKRKCAHRIAANHCTTADETSPAGSGADVLMC